MENITVNKEFHELHFDSIQALRGLAALFVVFQHVRFLNFGAFGVDIFFLYQRIHDHVYHGKKYQIFLPQTPGPDSSALLPDDTGHLSVAVVVSFHVPTDQTRFFPIWSKVCCLFLLISAAERSSLWYGSVGPLTVKCCSICCFSLPFTSA